jgi:hypothetical protein
MPCIVDAAIPTPVPAVKRPSGITVIAVLSFILSLLLFAVFPALYWYGGIDFAVAVNGPGPHPLAEQFAKHWWVPFGLLAALTLVVAAICFANGLGLLRLKNWARRLTLVLICLQLALTLQTMLDALLSKNFFEALFNASMLLVLFSILSYLFRPHVKQAFRAGVAAQ